MHKLHEEDLYNWNSILSLDKSYQLDVEIRSSDKVVRQIAGYVGQEAWNLTVSLQADIFDHDLLV